VTRKGADEGKGGGGTKKYHTQRADERGDELWEEGKKAGERG
jgi:hypothetical protein